MRKLLLFLLCSTTLFAQSGGQPVSIPVQNPYFAQLPTSPYKAVLPCWTQLSGIPGWQGGGWIFQVASGNPCGIARPPDGSNWALIQNSTIWQDSGVKASDIQATTGQDYRGWRNGVYYLHFVVANQLAVYPGYFEAKILLGEIDPANVAGSLVAAHELCSADGWANPQSTDITLSCASPIYIIFDHWPDKSPFDPNAHLLISISSNSDGWPILATNVSLTFTPE